VLYLIVAVVILAVAVALWVVHFWSYALAKRRVLNRQHWDLNICCGLTDGGGINADIVQHADLPHFVPVSDVTALPFTDKQFDTVLCSHTIEHVDDPAAMFRELRRVGRSVTIVIPPLWDIAAVLNVFEHRWIFLSFRKEHVDRLPPHIRLLGARWVQQHFGQPIRA